MLIASELVQGWQDALQIEEALKRRGYKTFDEVREITKFSEPVMSKRVNEVRSELDNSLDIDVKNDESLRIEDNPLMWCSPYTGGKGTLCHPDLVTRWVKEGFRLEKNSASFREAVKPRSIKPGSSDLESNKEPRKR